MNYSEVQQRFFSSLEDIGIEVSHLTSSYEENISKYKRSISGVVLPENRGHVIQVVQLANREGVKLYPISVGGNWAFGSRLPVLNDQIIVDLRKMNEIEEYNESFGVVRIQPGVTQGQLSDYLTAEESSYFLDVTGSGYHTSIIGNALERGIAYNSLRAERLLGAEVLLGSGEIIRCGYTSRSEASIKDLYRYGIGPGLDQLFFQSNFGIVLSASYQLHPRPENRLSIQVKFKENELIDAMDTFRRLSQQGVIDCIVHSADPYRSASTVCPLMEEQEAKEYFEQAMAQKEWSSIMSVYGPKRLIKAKVKEVKKSFRQIGQVVVFSERKIAFAKGLLKVLGLQKHRSFLEATEGLRGLVSGKATSDALHMATFDPSFSHFKKAQRHPKEKEVDVDSSSIGALFCVPLAPYSGINALQMVQLVRRLSEEKGLPMGVTLNALSEKVLEAVISLHFPESEYDKGHETFRELNYQLISKGFLPYRLNPENMDILPFKCDSTKKYLQALRKISDPNEIISPGRYD